MVRKENQKVLHRVAPVTLGGVGTAGVVNASATLTRGVTRPREVNTTVLTLTAQTVTASAANDHGSLLLFTFPAKRTLLLDVKVALTSTQAGFAVNDATSVLFALGSAAASNTSLTGTMVDIIPSTAGTGTTAGTIAAVSTATEAPKVQAASVAVYFNLSDAVTTGTGTLTLTGTVTINWIDLETAITP